LGARRLLRDFALALVAADLVGVLVAAIGSTTEGLLAGFSLSALLLALGVIVEQLPLRSLKPGDPVYVLMGLEEEPGVVHSFWGRPGSPTAKVTLKRAAGDIDIDVPLGAIRFRGGLLAKLRRLF
jgi:hypothetical protein